MLPIHRSSALQFVLSWAVLSLSTVPDAFAKRGSRGELESFLQWEHEFPGSLNHLEITPQGYIHAVSRYGDKVKIGGKKGYRTKRFLMRDQRIIWEGEAAGTIYMGDAPHPVIMEAKPEGILMQGLDSSGKVKWRQVLKGLPASWTLDPTARTAALVLMPVGWTQAPEKAHEATLAMVDTRDGTLKWAIALGGVTGGVDSFGNEIAIEGGGVWWAAGGRAARVQSSDGRLSWSTAISEAEGPHCVWAHSGSIAAVARGEHLFLFDAATGLKWERRLLKDGRVGGLLWTRSGLLVKFQSEKRVVLAQLDPKSGASRWEHTLKHKPGKDEGPPPYGMVATEHHVIIAANGHLRAYDLGSGTEIFDRKLKRHIRWKAQTAVNVQHLRARKEHCVLLGRTSASAFSLKDGTFLWRKEGYEPPQDIFRRMRMGALKAGFQSFHQLSPNYTSAEAASKAREAGRYGAGSYKHQGLMASAENLQEQYAVTQGMAQGATAAGGIAKFVEIDQELKNERFPANYAAFYKVLNMKLIGLQGSDKVAAVLLDLDTGETKEIRLPDSASACVSQVILDPDGNRMLLTYLQMGLLCKDENLVEAYRLP